MINNQIILGIIPARGGSKGVPEKNNRLLNKLPLITYTIRAAKKSDYIDRLIVSTDSEKIAVIARQESADVPFLRPTEFATDTAKAIDVLKHAVQYMEKLDARTYPLIVYLEPPAPLRITDDVDAAIELFARENPDSVVSVNEANQFHPILMKKIEKNRLKPIWKDEPEGVPRQLYDPTAYMRNGAVYVFRRENILSGKLYGTDIVPYIMPLERSVCIDDLMDWYVAEAWIRDSIKKP